MAIQIFNIDVVLPFISADNWEMSEPTQRPTKTTPPTDPSIYPPSFPEKRNQFLSFHNLVLIKISLTYM